MNRQELSARLTEVESLLTNNETRQRAYTQDARFHFFVNTYIHGGLDGLFSALLDECDQQAAARREQLELLMRSPGPGVLLNIAKEEYGRIASENR